MRTKEKDKITHLRFFARLLQKQSPVLVKKYPYYRQLLRELNEKAEEAYRIYVDENRELQYFTNAKRYSQKKAVEAALKLKRLAVLHAMAKNSREPLLAFAKYNYSSFNRPGEKLRHERFYQVLQAAWAVKNPAPYGVTKKEINEAGKIISRCLEQSDLPQKRKKERAGLAAQCRTLMHDIDFIIRRKLKPFFENIKDKHRDEALLFASLLKPVKTGRPPLKRIWRRKILS